MRIKWFRGLFILALALLVPFSANAGTRGGVIKVATVGEPPTLDPTISTVDVTAIITQHFFETLYALDERGDVAPLLASALPTVSADGKEYTIPIRKNVKFHNGKALTAKDVVPSIERWLKLSPRGKLVGTFTKSVTALDDYTVKIVLDQSYAPLAGLLAQNQSACIIIPVEIQQEPLAEFIGTGPYMLKERRPDQYITLVRYDGYVSPDGPTNGFGGKREQYADEIQFIPVPDANTRVEAAVAGQFDYVDYIPVESLDRIEKSDASLPVLIKPAAWLSFYMNTAKGLCDDVRIRQAVMLAINQEDCLAAAFGSKDFYSAEGSLYPKGQIWYSERGLAGNYNVADAGRAAALLKEAGYTNQPLRILTSRQYEFHYKIVQVAVEYLKAAGFTVDVHVVDWATLVQRRANPDLWDIYLTHSAFLPEPSTNNFVSSSAPSQWSTPLHDQVINAFNAEFDPKKRVELWGDVQEAVMKEVPTIKVGDFNSLAAKSKRIQNLQPVFWPFFWNTWLE